MSSAQTLKWILEEEQEAFSLPDISYCLPMEQVIQFITKATVLNELMSDHYSNYVKDLVESTYDRNIWDNHRLKRFVILDYPLSILESIAKEDQKFKINHILAGIYPFNESINAFATKSPFGDDVIFFSEWLFSFLWDFFHKTAEVFPEGTLPGMTKPEHIKLAKAEEIKLLRYLEQGFYRNWNAQSVLDDKQVTNSARYLLLMALIYIWGHELAHIFLGHTKNTKMQICTMKSYLDRDMHMIGYSYKQEQELDADMFASDIYFTYLYDALENIEPFFSVAHYSGFDFLRLLAHLEKEFHLENFHQITHPPSVIRLTYICLRHKEKLIDRGYSNLIEGLENELDQTEEPVPLYDYKKDLGMRDIFE